MCFVHLLLLCLFSCAFLKRSASVSLSNPLFLLHYCKDGHRQNTGKNGHIPKVWQAHPSFRCFAMLHCALCERSHWEEYTFRLTICRWESVRYFSLCLLTGPQWLLHMLSLSEQPLFWFVPAGDGVESVWTLSIRSPVDQSEHRSCPEIRRLGADLLFRGYSLPVDLKTIELGCWSNQGWAGAVQDGWCPWTETEKQAKQTDRGAWSFGLTSLICSMCWW